MKKEFDIEGMKCAMCASSVKKAIESVHGVSSAEVSLKHGTACVDYDPSVVGVDSIAKAVREAGYTLANVKA